MAINPTRPWYTLVSVNSGKVLDVEGASLQDGASVIQWSAHGGVNQQWSFQQVQVINGQPVYKIVCLNSGKVLDVTGGSQQAGAAVIQWPYHGGVNQQWYVLDTGNSTYKIQSVGSGKVLDVEGGSLQDGARIIQWDDHNGANQRWSLVPIPLPEDGQLYKVVSVNSGKMLAVEAAEYPNNAPVFQLSDWGEAEELWSFQQVQVINGQPVFNIVNRGFGYMLTVEGASLQDGARVLQLADREGTNQQWYVLYTGNNTYKIQSVGSGKVLTVEGASLQDLARIIQWDDQGGTHQRWSLITSSLPQGGSQHVFAV